MNGMRVKLTFTFSALGTCMPLVVTVAGLSEREMPDGKEFIHVKIPGLCIGGGGVNIDNQECGHLIIQVVQREYFDSRNKEATEAFW